MTGETNWDFRGEEELSISRDYVNEGYVIANADAAHIEELKNDVKYAFDEFNKINLNQDVKLEYAHHVIGHDKSNELRLFMMQMINKNNYFHRKYYNASKKLVHNLCGNELAMQKRPGLSVNLPHNNSDVLPIHADTWNGVSPFELNIWIPFVDCSDTMCLYILKREKYIERINDCKGLLRLSSDELFEELKEDLTWIHIRYGQILAFDQSLPHGYSLNEENRTHWSMNCRFKGLHTPYWDKKLGEYFMPITVKNCTRLGMNYEHPEQWI